MKAPPIRNSLHWAIKRWKQSVGFSSILIQEDKLKWKLFTPYFTSLVLIILCPAVTKFLLLQLRQNHVSWLFFPWVRPHRKPFLWCSKDVRPTSAVLAVHLFCIIYKTAALYESILQGGSTQAGRKLPDRLNSGSNNQGANTICGAISAACQRA